VPIYEYKCEACGHTFEVIQKVTDPPVVTCALCGGPVRKLLSPPGLVFKGTGWYVTDYPNAERKKAMDADKKGSANGGSATPSSTESKTSAKE
jgi:putative FmdB family regulatory protein